MYRGMLLYDMICKNPGKKKERKKKKKKNKNKSFE